MQMGGGPGPPPASELDENSLALGTGQDPLKWHSDTERPASGGGGIKLVSLDSEAKSWVGQGVGYEKENLRTGTKSGSG